MVLLRCIYIAYDHYLIVTNFKGMNRNLKVTVQLSSFSFSSKI